MVLNSRKSWCAQLQLSVEAKAELQFASSTGFGGYTVEHGGQIAHGQWTEEEVCQSSTWWELRLVLDSFGSQLQNENLNVVRIVSMGVKSQFCSKRPWVFLIFL